MKSIPIINFPVIYYLIRNNKIVYIGSTKGNFHYRIHAHLKNKVTVAQITLKPFYFKK